MDLIRERLNSLKPYIVFDFDGVLCDSINLSIESYSFVKEKYFNVLPEINGKEEYARIFSGDPDSCLYKWLTPNETKIFYEEQTKYSYMNSNRMKLFDGIANLLLNIPKAQVSILTTNLKVSVAKVLSYELGTYYLNKISIFSKELGLSKVEMFNLLFKKKNITNANTFYVCDSGTDIIISNEIGINSIVVSYGYYPIEVLQKHNPTIQVSDVTELTLTLKSILADDFKN